MEMLKGNLWKSIFVFSIPLVFSNLLQLLFNIADVAIVGKFAGALSLGAVGSTTLLVSLTTGWLIGISNGVNSVVAFHVGSGDTRKEKEAINTGFLISLLFGFITLILGFTLARPVLTLMGTKDELIEEAILYFRIYMLGSPALAIYNYGNGVLSAEGDTKKPLKYLAIAGVINVFLNLFFVICLGRASDGVAYASIISQYISALLIMKEMLTTDSSYKLNFKNFSLNPAIGRNILGIGLPAALQYSLFAIANLFVQSAVNTFDHVVVEGNSAAMNFDSLVYEIMAAFYIATTSFIAQNYGAGNKERILKTYYITTVYSAAVAIILGAIIHVFRVPLLYIFTSEPEVVEMGAIRLGILSITYFLSAFMDNATAACRGLGKTFIATIIVLMGTIVFRIVWVYTVFAYFKTLQSLYILYGIAFVLTAVFQNIYFAYLYKRV